MGRFALVLIGFIALAVLPIHAQPSASLGMRTETTPAVSVTYAPGSQPAVWPQAAQADRWWAPDKARHVAFSFLITLSTQYALENKAGWSRGDALPVSAGTAAVVGLTKETYDWHLGPRRQFSSRDLAANAAGILLAIGVIAL